MDRDDPTHEQIARGREAAARGSWREAFDLLMSARPEDLSGEDLELVGEAASWSGPTEQCIEPRERAFSAYVARGDKRGAARVALALVRDYGMLDASSVASGWSRRAERLLEDEPECPEHGHLARRRGMAAYARGDLAEAQLQLNQARDIAHRFGDRELEALALHNQGEILVREGQVEEGWAMMDEAAAAAAAGDLRPTATGSVYCWTISTCRDLLELRRAGEWTARFEQWCDRTSLPGGWRGDCRLHRAEVLKLQGRWDEAEREAESARADFVEYKVVDAAGGASYELGEFRLRRGDLRGAEDAFRRAVQVGIDPQPGMALLRLAQGKPRVGLGELQRALADVPNDRIERARLLPAFVELALAAGQVDEASAAAEELAGLASLFGSEALTAAGASARGIVAAAEGDHASAVTALRDAVRRWHALDAPYEAARARTALGGAYGARGDDDAAAMELEAAHAIFERLGAVEATRRVAELLGGGRGQASDAAFLFSDIVGSTSLAEAIGDEAWLGLVQWHDRTLRALFDEHAGQEVDHAGDGFFVAFPDAVTALACAVAIQRALSEHRRNHGFAPTVRIGVHATDAISVDGGYTGKGVHAAARIAALADANEIVASHETAEAADVSFTDLRSVTLKGLSEPVEVVSVRWT